eukprot:5987789-Pleurochrysis_carterae.AAC.1
MSLKPSPEHATRTLCSQQIVRNESTEKHSPVDAPLSINGAATRGFPHHRPDRSGTSVARWILVSRLLAGSPGARAFPKAERCLPRDRGGPFKGKSEST